MNNNFNNLWVEKYRPSNLENIVLSDETRKIVDSFVKAKEIPNLLLVGNAGIGKTSLAKILVNSVLSCQYLYINASDENGIDTIRNKVVSFAKTKSYDGNIKVIILDECDGITMEGQKALRNTIEEYSSICRFILTANYKHKIIQALQSRCQELCTVPPLDGVLKRILHILSTEKIIIPEDQKVILAKFVKRLYPDVRKIVNELQKKCTGAELSITVTESYNTLIKKILEYTLSKKAQDARKYLIENEDKFQADYVALLREMFNILNDISDFKSDKDKKRLLVIAEHLYRSAFVVDQEINFYACLLNLETI